LGLQLYLAAKKIADTRERKDRTTWMEGEERLGSGYYHGSYAPLTERAAPGKGEKTGDQGGRKREMIEKEWVNHQVGSVTLC